MTLGIRVVIIKKMTWRCFGLTQIVCKLPSHRHFNIRDCPISSISLDQEEIGILKEMTRQRKAEDAVIISLAIHCIQQKITAIFIMVMSEQLVVLPRGH